MQCWKLRKLELGRHLRPCVGKSLSFDAAVWQASRNPIATSYQESRCLFRVENEPSIKQLLPCSENKKLPSFNILPVLLIQWAFVQQSSSHQSPVPNIEHTCRCQAVTAVTEPFSPLSPFLQRVRSMKSVSFAMLRAEEAGVFQTHETLCQEDSRLLVLQCDCFHKSSHYQGSRCLIRFGARLSRALNNSSHAGSINTCPNSMSCHSCQLMRHSFSNPIHSKSPVPNREHTFMSSSSDHCHCERTILSTVSILAKVRSMKSVSFAMCNVASWKAGVFPDTWDPVKKILDSWLLMPLRERLPPSQLMAIKEVDLDMSCFLPSSYPMCRSDLPIEVQWHGCFHDFLVRWVQQLQWQSSSLTDVKDLFTQEVLPKSFLFYLPLLKDWTFSPTESSSH